MTATQEQGYIAEALCSAFYNMPFSEFLGEVDTEEGHVAYFHLGEKPKDMRVSVITFDNGENEPNRDMVGVRCEWRNYHAGEVLKGEHTGYLSAYAATRSAYQFATEQAVVRALELYRDVIEEKGVAGNIADLVETKEESGAEDDA